LGTDIVLTELAVPNDCLKARFVAIDFETANPDLSSVCQVGVAIFEAGKLTESWGSLVNPEDDFHWMNVAVHGISEAEVQNAPSFKQVYELVCEKMSSGVVVSHTSFDRAVWSQSLARHGLEHRDYPWLDSARVVRRAWDKWAYSGYGLSNVCRELKIDYKAHDAVEDARAAGEVLIRAMTDTGLGLDEWLVRAKKSLNRLGTARVSIEGDPNGPFSGEELVFTGALRIPRREAAVMAARVGCNVSDSVKKTTTMLVVGDQDLLKLAGHEKSSKHRKAEELIKNGRTIRILRETDFACLVELS
jgi:DNA polymerase-3 subunit epsilon